MATSSGGLSSDLESVLRRAADLVAQAKSMPLSNTVLVSKDELLELLEGALEELPEELREARWMLREREEFLARTRAQADEILEAARVRAARMVERSELVREAHRSAQRTLIDARDEASRLRHDAEDYCDQKLAAFQIVLERTARTVQAGRERLQGTLATGAGDGAVRATMAQAAGDASDKEHQSADEGFFDQDRSQPTR
jgi:cell division septum initiation protein DivIVA